VPFRVAIPTWFRRRIFRRSRRWRLGYFSEEGLETTIELLFPVTKTYEALRDGRLDFVAVRRMHRSTPFATGPAASFFARSLRTCTGSWSCAAIWA